MKQKKQYVGWGGLAGEVVKGTKGIRPKTATDEKTMEDAGRTWSGVGFLKRIQLLFVAAPRSSAWLRCRRPPAPFPLPFPSPCHRLVFTIFYLFVVFFFASLFFWFCFSFSFYSEFANELRLKTKITCKARKVPKEHRQRRGREDDWGRGYAAWESVFHFWYFFAGKLKWDLFITFSTFEPTTTRPSLSLSLACSLAHPIGICTVRFPFIALRLKMYLQATYICI